MSSAAVVRDVFATTASFKRCTVLHNAFPVCTTVYVFQANSTRTLALSPSRPLQNTSTHHAVSLWLLEPGRYAVHTKAYYNGQIWKWTSQDLFCTEDRSRIAPGGPPFLRSKIVEMFGRNVALMRGLPLLLGKSLIGLACCQPQELFVSAISFPDAVSQCQTLPWLHTPWSRLCGDD